MFTFRTPIFFEADDGAGSGEPLAPAADPSLGSPSPDEQHFESGQDFRNARSAFLRDAPPILSTDEPAASAAEPDPIEAAVADLATPPAQPAPGATAPAAPAPAAPQLITVGYTEAGVPIQITPEQAQQHWQVTEALRTEAGVRAMIAQGLRALYPNATAEQIAAIGQQLSGGAGAPESAPGAPAPAPDPLANIADDDLVTGADLKGIVNKLVRDAVATATATAAQTVQEQVDPVRQAFEHQQRVNAQATADATYVELLGPTPPEGDPTRADWLRQAKQVQVLATQHLDPNNWNPADIRAALIRGHAQFVQEQDALLRAYAGAKKRDRAAQPTSISGGAPQGAEPAPEPQNLAEARAAAKAEGFFR